MAIACVDVGFTEQSFDHIQSYYRPNPLIMSFSASSHTSNETHSLGHCFAASAGGAEICLGSGFGAGTLMPRPPRKPNIFGKDGPLEGTQP